jgi:signal transduction histidine kinase
MWWCSVQDDGIGMNEDVLRQVFDPFFTTKMGQGGSGLGMNIVYNIVTGVLGGTIGIESTPAGGTSVLLVLPMRPMDDGIDQAGA